MVDNDDSWRRFSTPVVGSEELYDAIDTVIAENFEGYERTYDEDGDFRYIAAVEQETYGGITAGFRHRDGAVFAIEEGETCDGFYGRPGPQTALSLLVRGETPQELMNDIVQDVSNVLDG